MAGRSSRRSPPWRLLVAPHIVGAPQPESHETPIPEGLHHSFVVAVMVTNAGVLGAARRANRLFPATLRPRLRDHGSTRTPPDAGLTLVLGGARSGKSRHAEILAMATPPPWVYIATAQALDDEMRERIAKHKRERGEGWSTIEAPHRPCARCRRARLTSAPVLVDCLTLWLSNLMLAGDDVDEQWRRFVDVPRRPKRRRLIVVSNEVGLGIVPDNALGRAVPRPGRHAQPAGRGQSPTRSSSWSRGSPCR